MHLQEELLTAEWLQEHLTGSDLLGDDTVATVTPKLIGEGQGFMSNVYRLSFTTQGGRALSVVAKISNAVGASMPAMYKAEADYYRSAASLGRKLARMPASYGCQISASNTEFVLLLEDLCSPYAAGDQVQSASLEDAQAAMDSLAAFHAQWWHTHPSSGSPPPVPLEVTSAWQTVARMATIYVGSAIAYVKENSVSVPSGDGFPGADPEEVAALLAKAAEVICKAHDLSSSEPLTLLHGDYRPDNLMHAPGLAACPVDYQAVHYGSPSEDLAYYLSGALDASQRRQHEEGLLRRYHAALLGHGVEGYPWQRLEEELLRGRIFATFVPIMLASRLQAEKQTADDGSHRRSALSRAWLARGCAALADHYRPEVAEELLTRAAFLEVPFAEVDEELRGVVAAMASMPQTDFSSISVAAWREKVQALVDRMRESGMLHQVARRRDLCLRGVSCTLFSPVEASPSSAALLWLPCAAVLGGGLAAEGTVRAMCNAVGVPLLLVRSTAVPEVSLSALVDDAAAAYAAVLAGEVEELRRAPLFVCGNQEGGAVAAALLQRLRVESAGAPAGAVLLSPWLRSSCASRTFAEYGERFAPVLGTEQCKFKWRQLLRATDAPYDAVAALSASEGVAPPTLAVYAELDVLRGDVEDYTAAIQATGARCEVHCLAGFVNIFLYANFPCFAAVASTIRSFLVANE